MVRVRGIYDGKNILLLEALPVPPDTEVEVVVPDPLQQEKTYWQQLKAAGLVRERRRRPPRERNFTPIRIEGEPLSQTVIDNRR